MTVQKNGQTESRQESKYLPQTRLKQSSGISGLAIG